MSSKLRPLAALAMSNQTNIEGRSPAAFGLVLPELPGAASPQRAALVAVVQEA